jgi:hypothetical protein
MQSSNQGTTSWKTPIFLSLLLLISFSYVILELYCFFHGEREMLRGAVVAFLSLCFSIVIFLPKTKFVRMVLYLLIFISALGALDLLFHAPGSSVLGLTPRFTGDFTINFYGAKELYTYNSSPYGIESKYQLINTSNSFPFPTYFIYWACSGFGLLTEAKTALLFTLLNLVAGAMLIWGSMKLSSLTLSVEHRFEEVEHRFEETENFAFLLTTLFLILNSHLWRVVITGQTAIFAASCIALGLFILKENIPFKEIISGLLFAVGIMIKPNFAPFLCYFILIWFKSFGNKRLDDIGDKVGEDIGNKGLENNRYHCLRIFLATMSFIGLFVIITILIPRGVSLKTYWDFKEHIIPILEPKVISPKNISIIGLVKEYIHLNINSKYILGFLLIISLVVWWRKELSWPYWLVLPLIISPICWRQYTILLLPAQLFLAKQFVSKRKTFELQILIMSSGLLYVERYPIFSTIGLILILYLTLKFSVVDSDCLGQPLFST